MIKIHFDEPVSVEWRAWLVECAEAQAVHNAAVLSGESPKADSELYGKLKKSFYLNTNGPFFGKCAFCEDQIRANQHGDVEHFRPKGGIVDYATGVKCTRLGSAEFHPGYYWLAYRWQNLLPACVLCNQPSTEPDGTPIGKRNYFPLADESARAQVMGQEVNEQALLINPIFDDPGQDLGLDGTTGVMFARDESSKGKACLDILGLNKRHLPDGRAEVYSQCRLLAKALVDAKLAGSADLPKLEEKYQRIRAGNHRFAAAARLAIDDVRKELLAAADQL